MAMVMSMQLQLAVQPGRHSGESGVPRLAHPPFSYSLSFSLRLPLSLSLSLFPHQSPSRFSSRAFSYQLTRARALARARTFPSVSPLLSYIQVNSGIIRRADGRTSGWTYERMYERTRRTNWNQRAFTILSVTSDGSRDTVARGSSSMDRYTSTSGRRDRHDGRTIRESISLLDHRRSAGRNQRPLDPRAVRSKVRWLFVERITASALQSGVTDEERAYCVSLMKFLS